MVRTTLDLDASVLEALRRRGDREGTSIGQIASEALARGLAMPGTPPHEPFTWVTRDLGQPFVELEDKDAVGSVLDHRQ